MVNDSKLYVFGGNDQCNYEYFDFNHVGKDFKLGKVNFHMVDNSTPEVYSWPCALFTV
jgi:hypothetical protein